GILERLDAGEVIVGDGGYVMQLERRGYSGSLVAAGVSQTPVFPLRRDEAEVKAIIQKQLDAFRKKDIDFYMVEEGLEQAGLKAHLIVQPLGFHTPECNHSGYTTLAEYPFAMEARAMTRWDMQKYAREAYNAGIRYIGGCCGFEPYHIRAIAEELSPREASCQRRPTNTDSGALLWRAKAPPS
ncbi:hypothetical protein CRUP_029903, partial [Coryphaenoides rupestris]